MGHPPEVLEEEAEGNWLEAHDLPSNNRIIRRRKVMKKSQELNQQQGQPELSGDARAGAIGGS